MSRSRDPIEARQAGDRDLYDVASWEVRTVLDRVSVWVYGALVSGLRLFVVLLAALILVAQFVLGGLGTVVNPFVGAFVLLSIVPALGLAAYVWHADVTTQEPLELLVATFVLGVLFAGFAAVLNSATQLVLVTLGLASGIVGLAVQIATFFVVVGPVEEAVKLLAVRLYAFRSARFDAVIDGAVYGAVAGLGFATIENAVYITGSAQPTGDPLDLVLQGSAATAVRALVGPGHVIYSAFAGYYLGLAKFNPARAGPIVVKGLLIAAGIHALYNTLSTFVPTVAAAVLGVPWFVALLGFVVVYDGLFGYLLYRKLSRYRRTYDAVHDEAPEGPAAELTEFDG